MESVYPIRAVAKMTGLSIDILRAWERRYQAVVPERTDRGRQYRASDVERLRLLRSLIQKGHSIGGIARLGERELRELVQSASNAATVETLSARSAGAMLSPVLEAIENFDSAAARDELGRLAAVLSSSRDIVYEIAVPLMREVGLRWYNGTFTIAQEHMVSGLLRNILGSVMRLFQPSNPAMKVVLATPAGEAHEFGILAAAMLMSMEGIEPVYLGPNLPATEIAGAARWVAARAVVLGVTLLNDTTAGEVRAMAGALPAACELWIGGPASGDLDLSNLGRKVVLLNDLPALENECRRWRS